MRYASSIISIVLVFGHHSFISDEFIFVIVQLAMAKDPEAAFFKRLEGLQPCEVSELKAGTHIFAVYGLNCYLFTFIFASLLA